MNNQKMKQAVSAAIRFSILFMIVLNSFISFSQNSMQQRIGTINDETGMKNLAFSNSTYFIYALYNSPSSIDGSLLIKMDISGNILWSKIFFDSLNFSFKSIIKTYDNCLAVLSERIVGPNYYEIMLTKIDSSGNILWNNVYSSSGRLLPFNSECLKETNDHGFIITAANYSPPWDLSVLIRSDSAGSLLWNKTYRYGASEFQGAAIYELNDGTFLYSFIGYDQLTGQNDFWLMAKLDSAGNVINLNNLQDWDALNSAEFYPIGNEYYLLISSDYITCVNSNAKPIWIKKFNSVSAIINKSLKLSNKGFALTGISGMQNVGGDVLFATADTAGNILSSNVIGGQLSDVGYSLCQLSNGSIIITGKTSSFNSNNLDIYLIQTDSTGSIGCNQTSLGITNTAYNILYFQDTVFVSSIPLIQLQINIRDSAITLTQNLICSTTTTAVNEPVFSKNLILFPNPTDGLLTLNLGEQFSIFNITITNAFGQDVNRAEYKNTSQIELDIQGEAGLYFVKVTASEGMSAVYKVMKM